MGNKPLVVRFDGPNRTIVKTSGMSRKTNAAGAVQKSMEFVKALKIATPNKTFRLHSDMWTLAAEIHGVASVKIGGAARDKFLFAIARPFGGILLYSGTTLGEYTKFVTGTDTVAVSVTSAEDLSSVKWINTLANGPKGLDSWWEPQGSVVVVPLCEPWVNTGSLYTFTMQAMIEKGTAEGGERYVDVYISTEVGAKFPLSSIISFDVKAGQKTGYKSYKKIETKNAIRHGPQVSKSFTFQDVGRDCAYFGEKTGVKAFHIQNGYQIVPREGGDTVGPFWNGVRLDGNEVSDSALDRATKKLNELMEQSAQDVAKQFASMISGATPG